MRRDLSSPIALSTIQELMKIGKTARQIADLMRIDRKTVIRLAARHKLGKWLSKPGTSELRPMPADFAEHAPYETMRQLMIRYKCGGPVIARWRDESGAHRIVVPPRPKPEKKFVGRSERQFSPHFVDQKDYSAAGQAADYLRRFGPVVRCDERGKYCERGKFWRRGSTVLTANEIISRAVRNGMVA